MDPEQIEIVKRFRPLAALQPAHWQSKLVELADGASIHYLRTGGDKPALLLLHGLQAAGITWLRTARALEATYDVIMPDSRSHGASTRLVAGLGADILVSDTAALLQALGIDAPLIAGHSMGADIAGRLAARLPTARAVALIDPALRNFAAALPASDQPAPWMAPILEAMRLLRTQPHAERMVTGLRLLPPGTGIWGEEDYVTLIEAMTRFDPAFYQSMLALGPLFEEPAVIAQIACPLLLLSARPMMPGMSNEDGVAAFENNWQQGRHIHFADSGHFIHYDQFARFIDLLSSFLGDQ